MKGFRGCENQSKLNERLPEIQSRLFENQEFVSLFILHFSFLAVACRHAPGHKEELKMKN
jgi:hypothetical protein